MEKTNWIVALVVGALVGFFVGHYSATGTASPTSAPTAANNKAQDNKNPNQPNRPAGPDTLFKVPIDDSPIRGNKDAKVTVVEFSDFQCPFCGRAAATVDQIRTKYGDDVRIVYKQNPLPFHPHAGPAAEASLAAADQGKFWEMYDLLFKNQQKLEQSDLEGYAQQIGLDMDKFKASLANNTHKAQIDKEKAMAASLGATGTPAFFINGHKLVGAQPIDAFSKVIDEQKALAEKTLSGGVSAADLYANLTARGVTSAPAAQQNPNQPPAASAKKVDIASFNPVRGPSAAPVTIVEWSDFQCPFCGKVEPTIKQIKDTYGDKVKFVWRNQPLPFHPHAQPGAKAAMAANEQGKFWEMHDTLFTNQQHLEDADIQKYAQQIGLDMNKFKADMDSPKVKDEIDQDMKAGSAVGANGTPAFFINGKSVSGAQPFDAFKSVIDEQLKKADELKSKGVSTENLYAQLMDLNIKAGPAPGAPSAPGAPAPGPDQIVTVDLGDAPVHGKANAPVTIVEFSDFQCPFCSRGYQTVNTIEQEYGDKVKVVFKNNPLPFHPHAEPAAEAALAAGDQGKFWEMYDQLFTHQNALERADFEKYGDAIHLDMKKFKEALDTGKFKDKVAADLKQGQAAGVSGTPTFVINGHKLVGAQPPEAFKKVIDDELSKGKNVAHK